MMPGTAEQRAFCKTVEQRVRGYMAANDLWPATGPLLVAVSGGPDSTALLLILARLARQRRSELVMAHLDHKLRGPEAAARDKSFIHLLREEVELTAYIGERDVARLARRERLSLEDAGRRERYSFLADVARECGATHVATGHTASDQAETVLLHLIRGAGLSGVAGMAPASRWPVESGERLTLVRPLLCLEQSEAAAYCQAAGLQPIEDESNLSADFERNRVRNELLPLLRTFNPSIEMSLLGLARDAREEADLQAQTSRSIIEVVPGGARIGLDDYANASRLARRGAAYFAVEVAAGERKGFYRWHFDAIETLLASGRTGDSVGLPRGFRAARTRDAVVIQRVEPRLAPLPPDPVALDRDRDTPFGHLVVRCGEAALAGALATAYVDAAAAAGLQVRRRWPGDRFQPLGMTQEKKLQDFLVDAHVPRDDRDRVPLFVNERGIVCVGGLRIAEWAKPRQGQARLTLSYREAS